MFVHVALCGRLLPSVVSCLRVGIEWKKIGRVKCNVVAFQHANKFIIPRKSPIGSILPMPPFSTITQANLNDLRTLSQAAANSKKNPHKSSLRGTQHLIS